MHIGGPLSFRLVKIVCNIKEVSEGKDPKTIHKVVLIKNSVHPLTNNQTTFVYHGCLVYKHNDFDYFVKND